MPIFDAHWLRMTALLLPPLLLSLTVHEYAHARTALAFGDTTARDQGRVSLNPLRHLDPMGTLVLIVTRFIGWAKPVPVNPAALQPRRLGDILVSLAGPLSNLALAILAGLGLRLWVWAGASAGQALFKTASQLLLWTTIANIGLFVFNLLPLFPLDGHHVARELLPADRRPGFMRWQVRSGTYVLLALIFVPRVLAIVSRGRIDVDPVGALMGLAVRNVLSLLGITDAVLAAGL